jgi:hypothetical protein
LYFPYGKKLQFFGFVYEGAFKLGFLDGRTREEFKKNIFHFLEEKDKNLAKNDESMSL